MNYDDIIRMAREAGFEDHSNPELWDCMVVSHEAIERFAYLVAAAIRARGPTGKQSLQVEPVAHSIVAGALFDLMGWLTSRKERLVLSSADEALPAVEVIIQFAAMRDLSLDDPKVLEWQTLLNKPAPEEPTRAEKMREAGYTRRFSLREFPIDKPAREAGIVVGSQENLLEAFAAAIRARGQA
ncbi:hypothetical protein UFOVP503_26 [uncultured Caudovirales phage]|uniref:Uncharacterized protein n=1 Tax=uncultured Caudovirales phage TaxID=2100421 RepID=A0A6J5NV40_9CAUD|nr:hypothetical protein UFOVP503_26 [uncultured Caudovirales phage]CAB4160915.1 hypothetical protein UFOVP763_20 [uncultured Caudovirales phage]